MRPLTLLAALMLVIPVMIMLTATPSAEGAAPVVTASVTPYPVLDGDLPVFGATVTDDGTITSVLIQICKGVNCFPFEPMVDKGGGKYEYAINESFGLEVDMYVSGHIYAYDDSSEEGDALVEFTVYPRPTKVELTSSVVPGTVYPGESVTINGTATYDNDLPAVGATVSAKIAGVGTTEKATADDDGNFSIPYTAPDDEGSYDITVSASIDTFQTSSDLPLKVVWEPKPDLEVTSVELSQTEAFTGDLIKLNVTVANTGNANATATVLGVYAGASSLAQPDVGALVHGASEIIYLEWDTTGADEGKVTLSFIADFNGAIAESDEDDNTFEAGVTLTEWVPPEPLGEGTHTVFVEMFSTTWCGPCIRAEAAMEKLWFEGDEHYFHFVTMVTEVNEEADDRMEPFGFTSVPDAVFDGGVEIEVGAGDDAVDVYRELLSQVGAREVPEALIEVSISDVTSTSVDISVKGKAPSDLSGRLRVYVSEPESRHDDMDGDPIPFGFLGFAADEDITLGSNVREFTYTFEGTDISSDNLAVAAVLFDDEDEAIQADAKVLGDYAPGESVGTVTSMGHNFNGSEMTVTATVEGDGDPVVRYWEDDKAVQEMAMTEGTDGNFTAILPPFFENSTIEYQVVLVFLGEETGSSEKETTVVPTESPVDGGDGNNTDGTDPTGGDDDDNTMVMVAAVVAIVAVAVVIALMLVMKKKKAAAANAGAGKAGDAPGVPQPVPGPQPAPGVPQPGVPQPVPGPQPAPGAPQPGAVAPAPSSPGLAPGGTGGPLPGGATAGALPPKR